MSFTVADLRPLDVCKRREVTIAWGNQSCTGRLTELGATSVPLLVTQQDNLLRHHLELNIVLEDVQLLDIPLDAKVTYLD